MTVYFLRSGADGHVKIGCTGDVGRRMAQLQTGSATVLTLLRTADGDLPEERWLHRRFADQHVRDEWFEFVPEMLTVAVPRASMAEDRGANLANVMFRHHGASRAECEAFAQARLEEGARLTEQGQEMAGLLREVSALWDERPHATYYEILQLAAGDSGAAYALLVGDIVFHTLHIAKNTSPAEFAAHFKGHPDEKRVLASLRWLRGFLCAHIEATALANAASSEDAA
ncbi:GIY-YIG nuclease family protein [Roseomonas sp. NAR14]|uniref:GIY-YIG nuclease family protein n=1 Tax=Roseomonas acroporae TaxID=2937791 RepID=A0A9X2BXR5_9PROT|nr:GIY-YIG nuclease family protein [Roseomonas acroporae]